MFWFPLERSSPSAERIIMSHRRKSRRQPRRSRGKCKHLRAVFIELNRRGPWTKEEKKAHVRRIREAVNRGSNGFNILPQPKPQPSKLKAKKPTPEPMLEFKPRRLKIKKAKPQKSEPLFRPRPKPVYRPNTLLDWLLRDTSY